MKKAFLLFSMVMAVAAVAEAQQKPPAPKIETVKFPPPKIVKDTNGNVRTKKSPQAGQVNFAKPRKVSKTKPDTVPNR